MRRLLVALALVAALVAVPVASAGPPYHFSNRALFEKSAKAAFIAAEKPTRYTVHSIGCAKDGVGRYFCAVAAESATSGPETYVAAISCPNDNGGDHCRITISRGGF